MARCHCQYERTVSAAARSRPRTYADNCLLCTPSKTTDAAIDLMHDSVYLHNQQYLLSLTPAIRPKAGMVHSVSG